MSARFLSTKTHGLLDYMTAATLPLIPRIFAWDPRVRRLQDAASASAVLRSVLTDYEWGVTRRIPMWLHLAADVAEGAFLVGAAAKLRDAEPEARVALAATGAFYVTAALLTRVEPRGRFDHEELSVPFAEA